jgi:predicted nucleic acid-binding protein
MLVDSSVWIDYLRGGLTPETLVLKASLERGDPIWLAPPILQEVLQGADSQQRFKAWDAALGELPMVQDADLRGLTRAAALLYARCRWQGFTPRSANDCLIAAYAIRARLPLLHRDRDFDQIGKIERALVTYARATSV